MRQAPAARARGADAVAEALRRYADRGVFRGLSVHPGRGRSSEFRFAWLTRHPMTVSYDPKSAALAFRDLLPGLDQDPKLVAALRAIVQAHTGASVPASRRIDARRTRVRCALRAGRLSLSLLVRGTNHQYAIQRGLNLVNQLFLHLQAYYPEYLVEQFGFSSE